MDEMKAREQYDRINQLWLENRHAGRHAENVCLMRDALKNYPNDALLLVQLSSSLERLEGTDEEKRANLKESIALQEQILRYGEDSEVRSATLFNICFAYEKMGERDKALEQAKKLPNLYKARENALVHFLAGDEQKEVSQAAMEPLFWALKLHLHILGEDEKLNKIMDILEK